MDEQVDIVDEKDEVLYSVTKKEAHEKGLLHRTSGAILIDSKNRWLFVKQSSDRQDAGQYVHPVGGHVKKGETEDKAITREAKEEIGIESPKIELVGKAIFNRFVIGRQENHLYILYKIISDKKPILNHESESFKYFTVEELKKELKNNPQLFGGAFHFIVKSFYPYLLEL